MVKKGFIFGFILMLSMVLSACNGGVSIQDDLISFVNDGIGKASEEQKENLKQIETMQSIIEEVNAGTMEITEEQYVEFEQIASEVISSLDSIPVPETEEVKNLREEYIEITKKVYFSTVGMVEAIKNEDQEKMSEETMVATSEAMKIISWFSELNKLAEENEVLIEQKMVDGLGTMTATKK
ncbi:hypothetical protein [Longirhabdus pacifica]|uniref:hypothetical protein n=1 Tax=Longirhabdus pacifica TaxID=2305227 RepID=UPI0010086AFD|nr:hypothetical protein [Longirhabdus pacifica]